MQRRSKSFSYYFNYYLRYFLRKTLRFLLNSIYIHLRCNKRFYCKAIFKGWDFSIQCQGAVTCFCGEFGLEKPLGNVYDNSMEEIWRGEEYEKLRDAFRKNRLPLNYCSRCAGAVLIPKHLPYPQLAEFMETIHIETTVLCNLDCSFCHREFIEEHRGGENLKSEKVYRLLDEIIAKKTVKRLIWVGFGEPFLDKKLYDYTEYVKKSCPEINISSSTNAIVFSHPENARRLVQAGMDLLVVSIDGPNEEIYLKYRRGGSYHRALQGIRNLAAAKRDAGAKFPTIIWQYILFNWNDKDWMIKQVVETAQEAGVDILHFLPTFSPLSGISLKYVTKPYFGMIYRFSGPEHDYNPHNRAKVIDLFKK